ncbi:MAG: YceG family protein [Cellulosilyticum sp.]|nr:YceG family protein [Cellulosilyticum sp.]
MTSSRVDHYFCEVIGLNSESSYNDTLALFNHKLKVPGKGIIFDDTIPKPSDKALIDSILQELTMMRIGNYAHEDINLTSSDSLNTRLRQALDEVIALAIRQENFSNETIRNNFIAKLMIWCNLYTEGLDFNQDTPPKCLFYGPIKRHEVYFLMILESIGMDVIYFNPTHDQTFKTVETTGHSQSIIWGELSTTLMPFNERVANGVVVEKVTTYAKKATNVLTQALYQDTGIYKPWQFSAGTTRPIIMDSVIEDTLTYWNEPNKLRPGFKTEGNVVYTPTFFTKISGVYRDINEYYELIEKLKHAKNCAFFETPHLTSVGTSFGQTQTIRYHNMPTQSTTQTVANFNQQDLYSLAFCLNPDQTIKRDAIKEHVLYKRLLSLRGDLQEFILSKLEETFATSNLSFFNFNITDKERVRLMAALFTVDERIINLIDSYDFTSDVPKIVMYINSREPFNQDDAMLLGLMRIIGMDVILLSPNGANNLELVISEKFINSIKLDEFVHDLPLKTPSKNKKESFFSRLFR